ncbi:MAG: sensor histidine kinase [Steroidobacteraceae bacterium]
MWKPQSLVWRLVWRLVPLQSSMLIVFVLMICAALWAFGFIVDDLGHRVSLNKLLRGTYAVILLVILPSFALMTLTTLFATPIVVRRALARLGEIAAQAEQIHVDQRGTRLSIERVPSEVIPLVKAVNDALGRLDEGYERQQRFLLDAAHELRTPIAILQTRLESLADGTQKTRLLEDGARLASLAEQLLDLQRLNPRNGAAGRMIDLVDVARRVAADLAPLAIAAGYELSFDSDAGTFAVIGDQGALERAVANLVQNAIEHGGRRGAIRIAVGASGTIDVSDEGEGIPLEHRERIFEPFHRLQPRTRGAGLGLNLVRSIIERHGGDIVVLSESRGGACFRITLPAARTS